MRGPRGSGERLSPSSFPGGGHEEPQQAWGPPGAEPRASSFPGEPPPPKIRLSKRISQKFSGALRRTLFSSFRQASDPPRGSSKLKRSVLPALVTVPKEILHRHVQHVDPPQRVAVLQRHLRHVAEATGERGSAGEVNARNGAAFAKQR